MKRITILLVALCLVSCSPSQGAKTVLVFDEVAAKSRQAANVVGFVAPFFPESDARRVALEAAEKAREFDRLYALAQPMLSSIAAGGNEVPQELVDQVAVGAAASKAIEQAARALGGRNPDGSPK